MNSEYIYNKLSLASSIVFDVFYHRACRNELWDCLICKTHVVLDKLCQLSYYAAYLLPFSSMLVMSLNAAYVDNSLGFKNRVKYSLPQ